MHVFDALARVDKLPSKYTNGESRSATAAACAVLRAGLYIVWPHRLRTANKINLNCGKLRVYAYSG